MAGISAANKAAAAGWRTAIVDELPYGGTCALRGCDPKKILRRGAEIIDAANLMRGKGIDPNGLSINWAELMRHTHGFTDPVPGKHENGTCLERGRHPPRAATFTVADRRSTSPARSTRPHTSLVATGARPRPLGVPRPELT